jgi:ribosomal protein L11 methyltransferase
VTVPAGLAAAAAAVLGEVTGRRVEARPGDAGPDGAPRTSLAVALEPGDASDAVVARLVERLEALERRHPGADFDLEREEQLVEEDRGAVHRDQFRPFLAAPGLVVAPAWEAYEPRPGETVIAIDPGLAFGSGFHASTRLALGLVGELCAAAPPGRLLDVGTGTGLLALAAAVRGAAAVVAVDADPDAVAAARANVERNGFAGRVQVGGWSLAEVPGEFELIVANITEDVLRALAAQIAAHLAPAGALVLSGILAGGQETAVRAAYEELGLSCRETRTEGEWVAMLFSRAGAGLLT